MKGGVGAITLIDCMAAMPCAAGRRASAGITKLEKVYKASALSPQPSAVTKVSATRGPSIGLPQADTGAASQTPLAAVARA
jgi:hypothetical protein